jgi:hypothetical protein
LYDDLGKRPWNGMAHGSEGRGKNDAVGNDSAHPIKLKIEYIERIHRHSFCDSGPGKATEGLKHGLTRK